MWCLEDLNEEEVAEVRERNSYWHRLFNDKNFFAAQLQQAKRRKGLA